MAHYRYQQRYLDRLRQDQIRRQSARYYNVAPSYRYNRGGRYYEVNNYGADMLRQAVNYGYEEGFRAGQSDRQDRWGGNYRDVYAYQDASYGYTGYYVDVDEYRHYFREGFRRGYEDGYNSRYQYGRSSNGGFSILANILQGILNLQSFND
jgi:flagellar biosynthesis/type III secretory pathway protein FliH